MSPRLVYACLLLNFIFLTLLECGQLAVMMTVGGAPVGSGQKIDILDLSSSTLIATAKTNASGVASYQLLDSPSSAIVRTAINGRTHLLTASFTEWPTQVELSLPAPTQVALVDPNTSPGQRSIVALNSLGTAIGYSRNTASNGVASFHLEAGDYIFRHSVNGRIFYSELTAAGSQTNIQIPPITRVRVMESLVPVSGMSVSSYTTDGNAIGYSRTTNSDGYASFHASLDSMQFRVSKNGRHFFSPVVLLGEDTEIQIPTPTTVILNFPEGINPSGFNVAAWDYPGSAIGYSRSADSSGLASFHLTTGTYRFRLTHNGREFFSEPVLNGTTAEINLHSYTSVQVLHGNEPVSGISVSSLDNYSIVFGYSRVTDSNGMARFSLPDGDWHFRVSRLGVHHLSASVVSGQQTTISMPHDSQVQVNGLDDIQGINISLIDSNHQPLGYSRSTNSDGMASFSITTTALLKFRLSHNGRHFFSNEFYAPSDEQIHVPAPTTVSLIVPDEISSAGISVSAWDTSTAIGYSRTTNASGTASFSLLDGQYRFRVSHNGKHFFSETVSAGSSTVIDMTPYTKVLVTLAGEPWAGVSVQSFDGTENAKYSRVTNAEGVATFSVPDGTWRFRVSRHGRQHFSEEVERGSQAVVQVPKDTDIFVQGLDTPAGLNVSMVDLENQALGYSRKLSSEGLAQFSISTNVLLKFLVNFNGRQFFSEPTYSSESATIVIPPATEVMLYGENGAVTSGKIETLFSDGTSVKYSRNTDSSGVAKFHLPQNDYQFKHSIAGRSFYSEVGTAGTTFTILIPPAVSVRVLRNNQPVGSHYKVQPVTVDLQNSGPPSYTGVNSMTAFHLPTGPWKFKVSDLGQNYYSNDVTVGTTSTSVSVQLSVPSGALNVSWTPHPSELTPDVAYGSDTDLVHTISWEESSSNSVSLGCLADTMSVSLVYSFGSQTVQTACPGQVHFYSVKRTVVITYPGAVPDLGEATICLESNEAEGRCWDANSGFEADLVPGAYSASLITSAVIIPFEHTIDIDRTNDVVLQSPYLHRLFIVRGGVPVSGVQISAPSMFDAEGGWLSDSYGRILLPRMMAYPANLTMGSDTLQLSSEEPSRVWHLSDTSLISNPVSPINTASSGFATQYVLEADTILLKIYNTQETVIRPSPSTYAVGLVGPMANRGLNLSLESSSEFAAVAQLHAYDSENPFLLGEAIFTQSLAIPEGLSEHQIFPILQSGNGSRWISPGNYRLLIHSLDNSVPIFAVFVEPSGNESYGNHGQSVLIGY